MKQSLYLETSVVGAYLDNDDAFRRDLTMRWWERERGEYETVTSILVRREIEQTREPYRTSYLNLLKPLTELKFIEEVKILAEGYLSRGIFHRKFIADAFHAAFASFYEINYLVTWNFGHLANVRKQARLRAFNAAAGFSSPVIVTPEFLVHAI